MKKFKGFSSAAVAISIIAVVFVIAIGLIIYNISTATHYEDYDFNAYIAPDEHNGYIGDHIKGNPDAPVKIVEYADYMCPLCASVNPLLNKLVEEDKNLAIIFRYYIPNYHANGTPGAIAAESAGLQGYWQAYSDKLFITQDDWGYVGAVKRTALFKQYFEEVTNGEGDLEKFEQDLNAKETTDKVSFDIGIAKRTDIPGTPALYVDGNYIDWTNSEGSSITVNYRTIVWDSAIAPEGLPGLLSKIAEAELEPNE